MRKLFTSLGVSGTFICLGYFITEQIGHTFIIAFIFGGIAQSIQDVLNKK
jgi:hypothetical protein